MKTKQTCLQQNRNFPIEMAIVEERMAKWGSTILRIRLILLLQKDRSYRYLVPIAPRRPITGTGSSPPERCPIRCLVTSHGKHCRRYTLLHTVCTNMQFESHGGVVVSVQFIVGIYSRKSSSEFIRMIRRVSWRGE